MRGKYNVAIVGATGAVGLELLKILHERLFPINQLSLYASERSAGRYLSFRGSKLKVQSLRKDSFKGIQIAFFTAGKEVSKKWVPLALRSGATVIDNTSAFRMEPDVPLVVPEVNGEVLKKHHGLIANPNCCAAPLALVLKPLHDEVRIKRVVVSTYQSVSGAGLRAISEMEQQTKAKIKNRHPQSTILNPQSIICDLKSPIRDRIFPYQIAFNVIPQIPQRQAFLKDGYTHEETKLIKETQKILGDDTIKITATCVRVPIYRGHSESVNIETIRFLSPTRAREILKQTQGVKVIDNPFKEIYPTPLLGAGRDEVLVGRIRKDPTLKNGLNLWIVGDNLRKGAALNAVHIAEYLIRDLQ